MTFFPKQRPAENKSLPNWLQHATDDFGFFALRVSQSGSVVLMDRLALMARALIAFLEEPTAHGTQRLRDSIAALDAVRQHSDLCDYELPVALWTILRSSDRGTVLAAAEVLEPIVRNLGYVTIKGQA